MFSWQMQQVGPAMLCVLYTNAHKPENEEPKRLNDFMLFPFDSEVEEQRMSEELRQKRDLDGYLAICSIITAQQQQKK